MTDLEILNKAVEKAKQNGFVYNVKHGPDYHAYSFKGYAWLIFNHDFAKAFWGQDEQCTNLYTEAYIDGGCLETTSYMLPKWQYHLQQMVLEKEPLKYIAKFL